MAAIVTLSPVKNQAPINIQPLTLQQPVSTGRFSNIISQQLVQDSHAVVKQLKEATVIKGSLEPVIDLLRKVNQQLSKLAKDLTSPQLEEDARSVANVNLSTATTLFCQLKEEIESHQEDGSIPIDSSLLTLAKIPTSGVTHTLCLLSSLHLFSDKELGEMVKRLNAIPEMFVDNLTGDKEIAVSTRPFFHLAKIHQHEQAKIWKESEDYGAKAFTTLSSATSDDRYRAIRRTEIELLLHGLQSAIQQDRFKDLTFYTTFLEKTCLLAPEDSIFGQKNVGHQIFLRLYEAYKKDVVKESSSLPQPQKDFGRTAFLSEEAIYKKYKLQALEQVIQDLRAAWRL